MHFLKKLSEHLNKHIVENEFAKDLIMDAISYRRSLAQTSKDNSPITFLLAGDNATGKTHMANVLADFFKVIFPPKDAYEPFTLDMSAFKSYNSGGDILGSEKTYNNSFEMIKKVSPLMRNKGHSGK